MQKAEHILIPHRKLNSEYFIQIFHQQINLGASKALAIMFMSALITFWDENEGHFFWESIF